MKTFIHFFWILLLGTPLAVCSQSDSIRLSCPLSEAVVVPPNKKAIHYDPPDLCVVLTSLPDTTVKACVGGRVTNVEQNEEGGWDVVFFYKHGKKDYYFWYTGLDRLIVKKFDMLKTGQPIGYIKPGQKIEMLMYNFETQVDPSKYLDCKSVLSGN